jgi:transcriptional regulator with XRE-family HTH domain
MKRGPKRAGKDLPRLKRERERRAWSQEDLAREAGLSQTSISNLEAGKHGAYPGTVRKLAMALGVEPIALYGEGEG